MQILFIANITVAKYSLPEAGIDMGLYFGDIRHQHILLRYLRNMSD
jgi:hypothetical protein